MSLSDPLRIMADAARRVIAELRRGEVGQTPYVRGLIFIGHWQVGAAMYPLGAAWGAAAWLVVALAYWLLIERRQIRRGADRLDSLEDTAGAALGAVVATFLSSSLGAALSLAAGFAVMVLAEARR